jgi:multidrug efflux pump
MTSAWWVHLSTAMVFGLAFATVLTLVFCPVMLSAPTVWKQGWQRLRGRFRKDDGGTPDKAEERKPVTAEPEAFPQAAE